jgi:hypothetical protein
LAISRQHRHTGAGQVGRHSDRTGPVGWRIDDRSNTAGASEASRAVPTEAASGNQSSVVIVEVTD